MVLEAPVPIAMRATTEPTPMMMPSMVRAERSLLAASARRAMRKFSKMSIASVLTGQGQLTGARRTGDKRLGDVVVADDLAIGEADDALGMAGDKRVVG